MAISFNASSTKVGKAPEVEKPEIKKEFIQVYIEQLEEYTDGLLELNATLTLDELGVGDFQEETKKLLAKIIVFLGGDSLNFYLMNDDKKSFHIKNIAITGATSMSTMSIAMDEANRVNKENVNLYRLLQNTPDFVKSGFKISATAVPGVGDDIVVQISDGIYLGLDDSEIAMDYSKSIQINFLLLFAMIIGNKQNTR